ncbi:MAG: hypothetical protein ACR2N1_08775 [Rubripirellula sp.]
MSTLGVQSKRCGSTGHQRQDRRTWHRSSLSGALFLPVAVPTIPEEAIPEEAIPEDQA